MDAKLRATLQDIFHIHWSGGDGKPEGMAIGGGRREQTTASYGMRWGSGIGYGRCSGERRTLCGETTRVRYSRTETVGGRWADDPMRRRNGRFWRTGYDVDSPLEGILAVLGAGREEVKIII